MNRFKLILGALFMLLMNSLLAQKEQLKKLDFFIGEWELITSDIQPDGSFKKGIALSNVKYILDGYAIQDDYRTLNKNNEVIFRGTSIRSFNKDLGKYQIVWLMPGVLGLTEITAQFVEGKLVGKGKGYDEYGQFIERFEYFNISDESYSFKMDRSYDNGEKWIENFGSFTARKLKK